LSGAGLEPINGSYQQKWVQSALGSEKIEFLNEDWIMRVVPEDIKPNPVFIGARYDHKGVDENGINYPGADEKA
jgi:hypothetical protein